MVMAMVFAAMLYMTMLMVAVLVATLKLKC